MEQKMSQQITGAMEPGWAWRGAGRMRACGIRGPACLQDHESECSHRRQYVPRNHMVWALGASRGSCWASLVTRLVKNPPAMRETWVQSLSWEDPLKEGLAAHSSVLAWRIPMDRGAWWAIVHGIAKSRTGLSD